MSVHICVRFIVCKSKGDGEREGETGGIRSKMWYNCDCVSPLMCE